MEKAVQGVITGLAEILSKGNVFTRFFVIPIILIATFYVFEQYTGFGFNLRMSHQVELLERLEGFSDRNSLTDSENELELIHFNLASKLSSYVDRRPFNSLQNYFTQLTSNIATFNTLAFLSSSLLWFVLGFIAFFLDDTGPAVGIIIIVVGFFFGFVGEAIPQIGNGWISNIIKFLILQIIPFTTLTIIGRKPKVSSSS